MLTIETIDDIKSLVCLCYEVHEGIISKLGGRGTPK